MRIVVWDPQDTLWASSSLDGDWSVCDVEHIKKDSRQDGSWTDFMLLAHLSLQRTWLLLQQDGGTVLLVTELRLTPNAGLDSVPRLLSLNAGVNPVPQLLPLFWVNAGRSWVQSSPSTQDLNSHHSLWHGQFLPSTCETLSRSHMWTTSSLWCSGCPCHNDESHQYLAGNVSSVSHLSLS